MLCRTALQASQLVDRLGSVLQQREAESLARHEQTAEAVQEVISRMNQTLGFLSTAVTQTFTEMQQRVAAMEDRTTAMEERTTRQRTTRQQSS